MAFPGLFDEVTDVHLTAFTTGFKEDIVVGAFTGNHVYAYELHTSGLTASLSGQEILLSDAQGNMLAKLEAPNMTDASGRYSTLLTVPHEKFIFEWESAFGRQFCRIKESASNAVLQVALYWRLLVKIRMF